MGDERQNEIVQAGPRDGLEHHGEPGQQHGDEQRLHAARVRRQQQRHVDAQKRTEEESERALGAF